MSRRHTTNERSTLMPRLPRRTLGKWRAVMVASTLGAAAVMVGVAAHPALAVGSPVGFAAQNGGTTGGGTASTVTVTTAAALDSALQTSGRLNVRVSGMISLTGMHKVTSDKTVFGAGSGSGLRG